jgi:hypothetical protein
MQVLYPFIYKYFVYKIFCCRRGYISVGPIDMVKATRSMLRKETVRP